MRNSSKATLAISVVAAIIAFGACLGAQTYTIPELIAASHDSVIHMLVNDDETLLSLSTLSTTADVVVDARLVRPRARLSDDKTQIYTDYDMVPSRVVRSKIGDILTSQSPGMRAPLVLSVLGGVIVIDGKTVQATNARMKFIKGGGRYLVFASRQRANGFVPVGGPGGIFEVLDTGRVNPLLKTSQLNPDMDDVPFEEIVRKIDMPSGRR